MQTGAGEYVYSKIKISVYNKLTYCTCSGITVSEHWH